MSTVVGQMRGGPKSKLPKKKKKEPFGCNIVDKVWADID